MPNYNIDWNKLIFYNLPFWKRKIVRRKWIEALIKPVKYIYDEKFLAWKDDQIYLVSHTNQKISLEKVLNDEFDPVDEQIYIELNAPIDRQYLYLQSEQEPMYIYLKWDSTKNYVTGEYATYGIYVWKATQASLNQAPFDGSAYWTIEEERPYLYTKAEYGGQGFIVWVPDTITFDTDQMKGLINYYKLAGLAYTIQTFTP